MFKSDLFNVGYFGAMPFLVMVFALGRRRFPLEARWLTAAGFVIPLTPLVGPLYHRVIVVGITGGVWLFACALEHELDWLRRILKRIQPVFFWGTGLWLAASFVVVMAWQQIYELVRCKVLAGASASVFGCLTQWLEQRAADWMDGCLIWNVNNLVPLLAVTAGLFVVLRSRSQKTTGLVLALLLAIEVGTYARHWITFSPRPAIGLFPETEETRVLRSLVGDGVVHIRSRGTCRTPFPPNTLSAYGIRTLEFYESILPRGMWEYLKPDSPPARLALCGVTHLVAAAEEQITEPDWVEVWRNPVIAVYGNTHRWPRYCALPANTAWSVDRPQRLDAPVAILAETQNRRTLRVPRAAAAIRVAENWSANWEYSVDGQTWLRAQRGDDGSLVLPLPVAPPDQIVRLRYHNHWLPFRLGMP